MSKNLIIFEDAGFKDLYPLSLIRPVFCLRSGARPTIRILTDLFEGFNPFLFCRPEIEELTAETTGLPVNSFNGRHADETVLINGRIRPDGKFIEALKLANSDVVIMSSNVEIAALKVAGKLTDQQFQDLMNGDLPAFVNKARRTFEIMKVEVGSYNYLWDFVNDMHGRLTDDFIFYTKRDSGFKTADAADYPGAALINVAKILVADGVEIMPGTVLDASEGPIILDRNVRIEPHTYVIGPTYVGRDSMLVGGKITACSIGPVCRVGGELEESIIQGYSNKYHAGFIGHSYIGEWVNFGAMSTNSDLKNNYKSIAVVVNGRSVETGSIKVGSFVGDFTRTAIGTLLNTGINIGLSCNILGGALVTEREIDNFTWFSPDGTTIYQFEKAIETIETAMARRKMVLSEALRKRLAEIYRAKQ
jgi:UDP-N-acetylglucosamine diphosphorylase/glucosamine-1-phosphate N-acetyltransferase